MIVIEGPDGAGKTTLIQDLLTAVPGLTPVERHCNSDGPVTNLMEWIDADLERKPKASDLYDRHALISEPIYGPIIRGSVAPGFSYPEWYLHTWGSFIEQKPLIIFCMPPLPTVMANVSKSHQMKGVEGAIRAIYYSYLFLALRLKTQDSVISFTWDYTNRYSKDVFDEVLVGVLERRVKYGRD